MSRMKLGHWEVGLDHPPFVIAEVGSNHDGSLETARRYIRECARQGAQAVKFQLFRTEKLINPEVPDNKNLWQPHPAWDLLKSLEVPYQWLDKLKACCDQEGVLFTCTPFDEAAVDALEAIDIPFYKIASGELTHRLFIEKVASTQKPIILSTGMAQADEVKKALKWLAQASSGPVVVVHCVSNYPPEDADANLKVLTTLQKDFSCEAVGLSDHSPGSILPVVAVALGARVIEKHVTVDRHLSGPDHHFALTIDELGQLVNDVQRAFVSLGHGQKKPATNEQEMRIQARRGLWAQSSLKKGKVLEKKDVAVVRPCLEGSAADLKELLGRPLPQDVEAHRPLPPLDKWSEPG